MAKEHKFHNSRVEVDTALSVEKSLDIVRRALATRSNLEIVGQSADSLTVKRKGMLGDQIMLFSVNAASNGTRTTVVTNLDEYKTEQMKYMYLIPMGPRTIVGYGDYRRVMRLLQETFQASDPTARCAVIERDVVGA